MSLCRRDERHTTGCDASGKKVDEALRVITTRGQHKEQTMLEIPEYHSMKAIGCTGAMIAVSVSIDGNTRMTPTIQMQPDVVARLVEACLSGSIDFMSFDEHPERLTGISLNREDRMPTVSLTARSLREKDGFPQDWKIADPRNVGATPWDGQMKCPDLRLSS
ncbi:hypothetical protein [Ruixingdingia sedimenti]|uniref:Uncharacterized protein n=1 Tax=Ruixingdingia sedimenti TaxID=3073604 RepID=A0ABU1FE65_9RHOB|nr:hypothetical protein [Xinfangfangia sp. LG-4]MDR5655189.1 hypothetical protein [Xinfangfangia sp. LG-4]